MYRSFIEYQQQYFSILFETTEFEGGYFTQSQDNEYINGNSIIVTDTTETTIESLCQLLATGIHTTKIQLPRDFVEYSDEKDCLYLVKYTNQNHQINTEITIELVDSNNYQQFLELSSQLQMQEYGSLYKEYENSIYLQQDNYEMYIVKYQGMAIGEFCYMPQLYAIESLIISQDFQRRGIGSTVIELASALFGPIYLSADNSSVNFYRKINCEIVDSYEVNNLYGSSYALLMYLNYVYN